MLAVDKQSATYLYDQVIDLIGQTIRAGTLKPGDRLPSLRHMSERLDVSVPTVKQAYVELERQGFVQARPKSGFYVRARLRNQLHRPSCTHCKPMPVCCRTLIEEVYEGIHLPGVLPLGIASPSMARPAAKALHRTMRRVMARAEARSLGYAPSAGELGLRQQLAYRALEQGGRVAPEDFIVTNGGQEALALALQATAKPGDAIAVESPTFHGLLELIESLGMLALEIETCPEAGVVLSALEAALSRHSIAACMFSSALSNPLGSVTDNAHRQALVALLEARGIPLIEDDVYGDLMFDGSRPQPAQFYSRKGLVLTAGSFSKTVAPGYRIGWLMTGAYRADVLRLKRALSCSSGLLQQLTLADFLASGDYDRHLAMLRPALRSNAERMLDQVIRHFPKATRCSKPAGGSVLWLELPKTVDSETLFGLALKQGISIAPGLINSPGGRYRHCIRLSFGHPWGPAIEAGIARLGELVRQLASEGRVRGTP